MTKQKSNSSASDNQSSKGGKRRVLPILCRIAGVVLIVIVIGLCVPITLPRVLGFEVYDVVSGSMEPEIPVGSVLYVKPVSPEQVAEGEVVAFMDTQANAVVAHRVVYNRTTLGEFVTKGDANNTEDREPIPYAAIIGRVEMHVPFFGGMMSLIASNIGKIYLLLTACCGLMLCMLANRLEDR